MDRFKRAFTLTVVGLLVAVGLGTPAQAANHRVTDGAPAALEISEANGWEYISEAEQKVAPLAPGDIYGCPEGRVCLYAYINYGGGRWQGSIGGLIDGCWNLQNSVFGTPTSGVNVNNASGSLVINFTDQANSYGPVAFYNWVDCNPGDGWSGYETTQYISLVPNLGSTGSEQDYGFGPGGSGGVNNWWHRYTSVKVINQ